MSNKHPIINLQIKILRILTIKNIWPLYLIKLELSPAQLDLKLKKNLKVNVRN
jgi:hypothetical protein